MDLDAHDKRTPERLSDALELCRAFRELRLTPCLERSRGGRGYHVWLLFGEPGAPAADLHLVLATLAARVPPADVFPSSQTGHGRAVFLPLFGGAPLLDADLDLVDLTRLELDQPARITELASVHRGTAVQAKRSSGWPPSYWGRAKIGGGKTDHLPAELEGRTFTGADGLRHARQGARNKLAGSTALLIVRRGGTFEDFCRWDDGNDPPLASDEAASLERWWQWAEHRARGRRATGSTAPRVRGRGRHG